MEEMTDVPSGVSVTSVLNRLEGAMLFIHSNGFVGAVPMSETVTIGPGTVTYNTLQPVSNGRP